MGVASMKLRIKTSAEYAAKLNKLGSNADIIAKKSIYKAASIVADEIKKNIKKIPLDNGYGTESDKIRGVSNKQKADLIDGFGITPIKFDEYGGINAKIGFDGYGSIATKKYPQGVPNQLLARSVESGTSFREKTPFVRPAVNKARKKAIETMDKTIEEEIKKLKL